MNSEQQTTETTLAQSTLEGQLREIYGRVAYTHKTHEKDADLYTCKYKRVKGAEIVLSAIGASSLLVVVFGDAFTGHVIGSVASFLLLCVVLYFKEAALGEQAQKHSHTAADLWGLRERLLSLLIDLKDGATPEAVRAERDSVNKALERIYKQAPRTSTKAYQLAQKALKSNEELFFAPSELDKMLPPDLRLSTRSGGSK